jgi:hypothetical protein
MSIKKLIDYCNTYGSRRGIRIQNYLWDRYIIILFFAEITTQIKQFPGNFTLFG